MFRARTAGPASALDQGVLPTSVSRRQRRRDATGRGFAIGAGWVAQVMRVVVSVVVLIIVAGILLVVLKANPTNIIVPDVHGWARSLAGPFDGMVTFHSASAAIAVNLGIAAVVYVFVGRLIVRLIGRAHR